MFKRKLEKRRDGALPRVRWSSCQRGEPRRRASGWRDKRGGVSLAGAHSSELRWMSCGRLSHFHLGQSAESPATTYAAPRHRNGAVGTWYGRAVWGHGTGGRLGTRYKRMLGEMLKADALWTRYRRTPDDTLLADALGTQRSSSTPVRDGTRGEGVRVHFQLRRNSFQISASFTFPFLSLRRELGSDPEKRRKKKTFHPSC